MSTGKLETLIADQQGLFSSQESGCRVMTEDRVVEGTETSRTWTIIEAVVMLVSGLVLLFK